MIDLAGVLDSLIGLVPAPLASADARHAIRALGPQFPSVPRGGFECRLGGDGAALDIQFCIRRAPLEVRWLQRWLADRRNSGGDDDVWQRLDAFIAEWSAPGGPLASLGELWLEFDADGTGTDLPAIFFALPHDVPAMSSWDAAEHALDLLLGKAAWDARRIALRQCFEACGEGVFIGFLGAMLSRPVTPIRANVKRLTAEGLTPFLAVAGWPSDSEKASRLLATYSGLVDRFAVALDVTHRLEPGIGFELAIDAQAPDSRWRLLLDRLVEDGLASPDRAASLADWTCVTEPDLRPDGSALPTDPAARALLGMAPTASRLGRRLNHLKLALRAGGVREAKAYLWFEHRALCRAAAVPAVSIGSYYSGDSVNEWRPILGEAMHYHWGRFRDTEPLTVGVQARVRSFYDFVPPASRVLDVGCGWGGPARMLAAERGCAVTGITASAIQATHCRSRGIETLCRDVEFDRSPLPGGFDVVLSIEMLEHVGDKFDLLKRLRACASRLVLSLSCAADRVGGHQAFGMSMAMSSVTDVSEMVEAAGWTVRMIRNVRIESLRTARLWKEAIEQTYGDIEPKGQIADLKSLANRVVAHPLAWAKDNPLIDIVAD